MWVRSRKEYLFSFKKKGICNLINKVIAFLIARVNILTLLFFIEFTPHKRKRNFTAKVNYVLSVN